MPSDGAAASAEFEPRLRLHPLSWLFVTADYLRAFLLPLLAAVVLGANRDFGIAGPLLVIVPLLAAALWRQSIFRYGFSERGLVIREGLFFRTVRTIDYNRIENVDTERNLLHRVFGVAQVRIDTSTGGKAEAMIRVLDLAAVQDMRDRIFARGAQGAEPAVEQPAAPARREETMLRLPPGELVRFGLIDNRGMIAVAALFGLLAQSGYFEDMEARVELVLDRLPLTDLAGVGPLTQALLVLTTAAGLIAATRVLSVAVALVTLFDFRLTRAGSDLQTRYGLLTRISVTLRMRRIQAVHQTATLLHRLFGRVSLRVDLAGGVTAGGEAQQGGRGPRRDLWLAPLCPADEAERLMRVALPAAQLHGLAWQGLAPGARARVFRLSCAVWLLAATVPAVWLAGAWAAVILPAALPLLWLHASLYVKHTAVALHDELLVLKRGWMTQRLSVAPRNRIQSVRVMESPFDRRHRMAQLSVDNAGASSMSHRLVIPYLERGVAERLAAALYRSDLLGAAPAASR